MSEKASAPRPEWPGYMTPTMLAAYSSCPARAGFTLDQAFSSLRRRGLRAALGLVAHGTLERRGSGDPFDEAWEAEADRVRAMLIREWAPARPPAPEHWPGWALTKVRMRRAWAAGPVQDPLSARRAHKSPGPSSDGRRRLPWLERWVQDVTTGMAGRPDLVERASTGVEVVDYKTGLGQAGVTAAQHDQLLFYASVVAAALGEVPATVAVEDARGARERFTVYDDDLARIRTKATDALQMLRESSSSGRALEPRPSEDACGVCPYRVACNGFLDTYGPDWRCGATRAGTVSAAWDLGSHLVVNMQVDRPNWASGPLQVLGLATERRPEPGEYWGFADLAGQGASAQARWNTSSWRWRPASG